jgi:predicted GNAT family N-acyltransferase
MNDIRIAKIRSEHEKAQVMELRRIVFIDEQGVSEEEELDAHDNDSDHYLLECENIPAGAARVRYMADHTAKIERVAILLKFRNRGLGKKLMFFILEDIKNSGKAHSAVLGAQTHAIPFYEALGFEIYSEEYLDAGIPHKDMKLVF